MFVLGFRYSDAFSVAIRLVLWQAAAFTALLVVALAVVLQSADTALHDT
jgi:hypothetical protein